MKSSYRTVLQLVAICGLALGVLAGISCGRPSDAGLDPNLRSSGDYTPVDGLAAYGTQCPYGTISSAKPLRVQLWNCPLGAGNVELTQPIAPLYFEADCKNRILSIRTEDKKVDASYYFLPNGEFDLVVDGVNTSLRSDGSGNTNCTAPLSINVFGRVACGTESSLDKATISFQSVMWAGTRPKARGTSEPVPQASTTPGLPTPPRAEIIPVTNPCKLPQSCYFYTQSELKQCQ